MINLEPTTEQRIRKAANDSGLSIQNFLDQLIDRYQCDRIDLQQAELSLTEPGEISLGQLKAKYDL